METSQRDHEPLLAKNARGTPGLIGEGPQGLQINRSQGLFGSTAMNTREFHFKSWHEDQVLLVMVILQQRMKGTLQCFLSCEMEWDCRTLRNTKLD